MKPGSPPPYPPASPVIWGKGALVALALLGTPGGARAQDAEEGEPVAPQVSCYQTAHQGGLTDESAATQLCRGARSNAPAKCFLRVQRDGSLSQGQAVQLCQFATSDDDPASCYLQAKRHSFSDDSRLLNLCQPPVTQFLRYCPVNVQ
ncbi:hypothetical protein LY474_32255 [Myxococcus stipitatus]|uniref:hypothetical protein n=1 Tax=Myxococcus stipitatus TaxID=83455 RepID=UPI001F46538D|nr:hypothetical protein [Myxococcus stipitatus]MCE9672491.1 hypothetical protein [Myxococcus stipitatus]